MLANTLQPALMTDPDQVPGREPSRDDRQEGHRFAAAYVLLSAAPTGLLIGWLIDRVAGTGPWCMLECCTLFLVIALVHLLRTLR